jgi:hypothetical protein
LSAIDSRTAHPEITEPVLLAEFAMSVASMMRGDPEASLAWADQLIDAGRPGDDANLLWGLLYSSIALSLARRTDESGSRIDQLESYRRRHPYAIARFAVNFALGLANVEADPAAARRHLEVALETSVALGSPMATRLVTGETRSLVIAHAPLAEAAATALEVIQAMWDGRDLGVMAHHVATSVIICAQAGRYHDAALIDGWLGDRGHALLQAELARAQQAHTEIDARLGDDAARLRFHGSQWEPATAIEYILATLRSISEAPAHPPAH